jgi:hypothetical protein
MNKNHQMSNKIDTLIIRKDFKEDKKIDINIIKEEDGILINIHGIWNHKIIIPQDVIIDQHLLQIGEDSTIIHGIKINKIMHQPDTKDYDQKELILNGWIIINGMKKPGT